jgi:uncharacterized protein YneF (UPF0154 family)
MKRSKAMKPKKILPSKQVYFSDLWKFRRFKYVAIFLIILSILFGVAGFSFVTYFSRPYFNNPVFTNYHLRLQLINNGQIVSISGQNDERTNEFKVCDLTLLNRPIYQNSFNSELFQVSWEGITGGEILKYYGLNLVGGFDDVLGYRVKKNFGVEAIKPFQGNGISVSKKSKVFAYFKRQDGYEKLDQLDFLFKDIELAVKKSNIRLEREHAKTPGLFGIRVFAEEKPKIEQQEFESKLSLDYDLIGNIVVFFEESEPTEDRIIDRFNNFIPLNPKIL